MEYLLPIRQQVFHASRHFFLKKAGLDLNVPPLKQTNVVKKIFSHSKKIINHMKVSSFIRSVGNQLYVCREAYSKGELESLFRLRYNVYRETYGDFLVPENPYQMDIDAYDSRAIHIGVFEYGAESHQAVGYMRLITEHETSAARKIKEIVATRPELTTSFAKTPSEVLPIFRFWQDKNDIEFLRTSYSDFNETSRFCLHPSLQGQNGTARFAVSSMVALSLDYLNRDSLVLIIVATHQAGFYQLFGFKKLTEVTLTVDKARKPFAIMHIPMKEVANRYAPKSTKPDFETAMA